MGMLIVDQGTDIGCHSYLLQIDNNSNSVQHTLVGSNFISGADDTNMARIAFVACRIKM